MMRDGYYGMDAGDWIAMTIFWVGLITLVVWALSRAFAASHAPADSRAGTAAPHDGGRQGDAERPEDILERRFASGELDEDAYRSMRATLRSSRTPQEEPR